MPRYFFHINDDGVFIKDTEGVVLPDIPDIKERLLKAAREVLAESEWKSELARNRSFEIADEYGQILLVVPFRNL